MGKICRPYLLGSLLASFVILPSCTSPGDLNEGAGGSAGSGSAIGGSTGAGGKSATGGRSGAGGAGAITGTGGRTATGGTTGATGDGGSGGTGGGSSGGATGAGGQDNTGGALGTGGVASTGGRVGTGGSPSAGGSTGTGGGAGGSSTVDATAMAAAMGFGANIGNTFDNTASWETGWGQPLVTQAFINGMASSGIKTVRVPVAWDTYAVNGVIDATKMNRIKTVVGWILQAGMYAIVNIHWDGGWIFSEGTPQQYTLTSAVKTKFASYWQQIGTAFASVGNQLIFEGLNEEGRFYVNGNANGTPDYAALNSLNQLFVTTVRALGGYNTGRALLIAGFNTNIDLTCVNGFTVPSDPAGSGKLFLSIHYYSPWLFCGLDDVASYGSPATTWGSAADKAALQSDFAKLASCSAQKKIPVILGEFGVIVGTKYPRQPSSRSLWMETVVKTCFADGIVPVLWDTGTDISRTNGAPDSVLQTVLNDIK